MIRSYYYDKDILDILYNGFIDVLKEPTVLNKNLSCAGCSLSNIKEAFNNTWSRYPDKIQSKDSALLEIEITVPKDKMDFKQMDQLGKKLYSEISQGHNLAAILSYESDKSVHNIMLVNLVCEDGKSYLSENFNNMLLNKYQSLEEELSKKESSIEQTNDKKPSISDKLCGIVKKTVKPTFINEQMQVDKYNFNQLTRKIAALLNTLDDNSLTEHQQTLKHEISGILDISKEYRNIRQEVTDIYDFYKKCKNNKDEVNAAIAYKVYLEKKSLTDQLKQKNEVNIL